jgi:hypothetical protein
MPDGSMFKNIKSSFVCNTMITDPEVLDDPSIIQVKFLDIG